MRALPISLARSDDVSAIRDLLARCDLVGDDLSAENMPHFLVARDAGGRLVGTVGLEIYGQVALLRSLAVDPSQRGSGLGGQLASKAETVARGSGITEIYLLTVSAERFFRRLRYSVINRDAVPPALQCSTQFRSLCPASATCLHRVIVEADS